MISGYPVLQNKNIGPWQRNDHQSVTIVPGLEEVIEQISPLPAFSLLIGICEDGTPLIVELKNTKTGPVLASGDNRFGNQQLLHSMLLSACMLNSQEDMKIHLVAPNVRAYPELIRQGHVVQAFNSQDMASKVLLEEFVRLGRDRKRGKEVYPMQILAIDELDLLLQDFEKVLLKQFQWLLEVGPEVNLWVVATISSKRVRSDFRALLRSFSTQIFGRIESPVESAQLTGKPFLDLSRHIPGVECTIQSGSEEIKVLIPQVGNSAYLIEEEKLSWEG